MVFASLARFGRFDSVNHTTNWKPDPYGTHEFRFFSADGKPTLLVMDGGKTSHDKPPPGDPRVVSDPPSFVAEVPTGDAEASSDSQSRPPSLVTAIRRTQRDVELSNASDSMAERPVLISSEPVKDRSEAQAPTSITPAFVPTSDVEPGEIEPMGRPLKIAFGIVLGVLAVSALAFVYVHLHHTAPGGSIKKVTAATTTVRNLSVTTTPVTLPSSPKSSAETAATALIASWSTGNRPEALTVATSAAVAALFSATYHSGLALDRGCSTAFTPIACTFGPPGGGVSTDPIYQVLVSQSPGGWYVSSVKIEN